jgi:hypothetical protein
VASLLVSAALNIGVGLALNALFPPPDINQEGPRLTSLDVTSAAYGQPINITFGTDRLAGSMIWALPIIEEASTTSTSVGKGGGQDVNQTSYTYFGTFDIAFALSGAQTVLRLWADGKLFYDATGGSDALKKDGVSFAFYSGGPDQGKDPTEAAELGAANTPAYRHLTRIVFDRLPLADYGNRIANITAEISYDATFTAPFVTFTEPAGLNIPGSAGGNEPSHMFVDNERGIFGSLRRNQANAVWTANLNTDPMTVRTHLGSQLNAISHANYGHGYFIGQATGGNATPARIIDAESGVQTDQFGQTGSLIGDNNVDAFRQDGDWSLLRIGDALTGFRHWAFHSSPFGDTGSLIEFDINGKFIRDTADTPFKALIFGESVIKDFDTAQFVPDDDRGSNRQIMYVVGDKLDGNVQVVEVDVTNAFANIDTGTYTGITVTETGTFNWSAGSRELEGWAVHKDTGRLLLSNGNSTVIWDPDTNTVLEESTAVLLEGINNYVSGDLFAYARGGVTSGSITVIDPRDLTVRFSIDLDLVATPLTGGEQVSEASCVWNDARQSIIFSREDGASNQPVSPDRIVQVDVGRAEPNPIFLDTIVNSLMSSYQGMTMANLPAEAYDVTTLAAIPILGFTINRPSPINTAIDILRKSYFFDGVESDWMMKFPVRGAASVLTIPEQDVGMIQTGEEEAVQEIRTQEADLPMRLNFRFKNREADYGNDVEHAKRMLKPNPAMFSKDELTIDAPVVFDGGTEPKQTAEKWLFTAWNERKQFRTVIPWTYLELDPTDVFQMGVFGETLRLRLAEQDVGTGLATEIVGVREQTFQFSSTGVGADVLGQITRQVPSSFPARVVNIDAPTLLATHLSLGTSFNGYLAMTSFDDTWPGGSAMKSVDNLDFSSVATSNSQAAWGYISTAPTSWAEVDSGNLNFRNRPQEVNDGGTMRIIPQNRQSFYASATDLNWYNGGNAMAVLTANGVEIIQFQTVTASGVGDAIDVSRLLRGRLGTEDIADAGGPVAGDLYVMLSDELNNQELTSIAKPNLPLTDMDVVRFWKGVTIGTQIENAESNSFTYTGRDLRPFSPTGITGTPNAGGLDVDWERRTRTNGEWLDGIGTVQLNENIEQYRVELSSIASGTFATKVVNDATFVNFTSGEIGSEVGITATIVQISETGKESPIGKRKVT